jgi:3'(2'), 5'-bisphosphate nucleotidase
MPATDPTLIRALIALADEAGAAIMALYGKVDARHKDDRSPVTAADEAAEAIILAGLRRLTPGIPVLAEEEASRGDGPESIGRRFWLVDPLDGTKEFLSKNGEFTVNIALVEDGVPTIGVVGAPAMGLLYATDGKAVWRRRVGGSDEPIAARTPPAEGLTVAVSRSHRDSATDDFLKTVKVAGEAVGGSSLKFCLVAEGAADLYPRFGRTMEWDTGAGHAVLRAAGGSVRTVEGEELRYGKPGRDNPSFIARGRDA